MSLISSEASPLQNAALAHFPLFHSQSIPPNLDSSVSAGLLWSADSAPGNRDRWRRRGWIQNVRLKCQLSMQTWLIREGWVRGGEGGSLVNYLIWARASFVTAGRPCLPPRRTSPAPTYVRPASLAPLTTSYLAG